MEFLSFIYFVGIAFVGIGGMLLGGLAYADFKERGQLRRANGAIWGISFLFIGFLLASGYYGWQISGWFGVLLSIICAVVWVLVAWAGVVLFRSSKRS